MRSKPCCLNCKYLVYNNRDNEYVCEVTLLVIDEPHNHLCDRYTPKNEGEE